MNPNEWIVDRMVYLAVVGSQAYSTATELSDYDVRGATIPPKDYYLGLFAFEQTEDKSLVKEINYKTLIELPDDTDMTIWSLHKMIKLAADGNPNMIELLFPPEDTIIVSSYWIERFFEIRDAFLSKLLKHRFSGYAMQQLKRMRNHYRWMHNPPTQPTREGYGIEDIKLPKDQIFAADKLIELQVDEWLVDQTHLPEDIKIQLGPEMIRMVNKVCEQLTIEANIDRLKDVLERAANRSLGFDSDFLNFLQRYKAYKNARNDWKSYENWKKNRNPERAELEKNHGYDTKHGMHLVRLMRMCREILEGKGVIVRRPDADELQAIRNGEWVYDEIIEWAEKEDKELDEVMKSSSLPKAPNRKLISDTLVEVTSEYFAENDKQTLRESTATMNKAAKELTDWIDSWRGEDRDES